LVRSALPSLRGTADKIGGATGALASRPSRNLVGSGSTDG
jgi:hypothetical protein